MDNTERNPLKTLPQYHFDRREMCDVFYSVFTTDQSWDIHVACNGNRHFDEFSLFYNSDEYYILHRDSGVLINWYKHMGRTNTCNKPDFTLDDFRVFCEELKEELLFYKVIK